MAALPLQHLRKVWEGKRRKEDGRGRDGMGTRAGSGGPECPVMRGVGWGLCVVGTTNSPQPYSSKLLSGRAGMPSGAPGSRSAFRARMAWRRVGSASRMFASPARTGLGVVFTSTAL